MPLLDRGLSGGEGAEPFAKNLFLVQSTKSEESKLTRHRLGLTAQGFQPWWILISLTIFTLAREEPRPFTFEGCQLVGNN